MHRPDFALSQVNALFWFRLGCEIPSISTVYAQAWRRCAQVIHMFVHRQQGSRSSDRLAGSSGSARTPVLAGLASAPRAGVRDTLVLSPAPGG